MSSATSIDRDVPVGQDPAPVTPPRETPARDTLQPWHFFLLMSLLAATAAVIMARQARPEHLVLMSLMIGAAGFAAGALYRTLVPLVSDQPPAADQPVLRESLRAGIEREKALVLRSIKELEFDRAMGKVSARDFDEMAGRLRSRAIALMRQLDGGSAYRELIERDLAARLRRRPEAAAAPRVTTPEPSSPACACGTANDPDAAFCKRCGSKLGVTLS